MELMVVAVHSFWACQKILPHLYLSFYSSESRSHIPPPPMFVSLEVMQKAARKRSWPYSESPSPSLRRIDPSADRRAAQGKATAGRTRTLPQAARRRSSQPSCARAVARFSACGPSPPSCSVGSSKRWTRFLDDRAYCHGHLQSCYITSTNRIILTKPMP